jgi:hypothetical protein
MGGAVMINKYLISFPIILLLIFSFITCDGNNGGNNSITQTVGSGGGTITSADGRLTLEIPPGALTEDTEITIILLLAPGEEGVNLLGYEFLPDGLEFLTPARVTVDVEEITGTPDEDDISFATNPIIITTEGEEVAVLDNLTLELDADTGSTTLGGDVEHFSRKVVGGKIPITASISGVPLQHPANTPLALILVDVVDVVANLSSDLLTSTEYTDSSISPVIYKDVNPLKLTQLTPGHSIATLSYACGDPGLGTFQAEIYVEVSKETTEIFIVEEVNLVAAILLGAGGITHEKITIVREVFLKDYKFNGKRDVLCFGSPPPTDPPPTDPPPTDPPPTGPPPTGPPPTDPPEPTKNTGLYESSSPLCGISSFTLIFTLDGDLSIAGFGTNEGIVFFDKTDNPLNFDHPELDLEILGVNGHKCDIKCNQAGDQITLTCSRPGASCTQTLTHKP